MHCSLLLASPTSSDGETKMNHVFRTPKKMATTKIILRMQHSIPFRSGILSPILERAGTYMTWAYQERHFHGGRNMSVRFNGIYVLRSNDNCCKYSSFIIR